MKTKAFRKKLYEKVGDKLTERIFIIRYNADLTSFYRHK